MPSVRKTVGEVDADVFTAIAHPVRRQILDMLASGDMTVNKIAEPFDVTRSAVSQHLSILLASGLVTQQKQGRENVYHLRPENLNEVYQWIKHYERFWSEKLDALEAYLDSMPEEDGQDVEDMTE